ncbi:unnamed protein product [Chrysoparadoxa australica]
MALTTFGSSSLQQDYQIPSPPSDGVSSLTFSPQGNLLVAGSWDSNVRCWEVNAQQGQAAPKAETKHDGPVLCTSFSGDGQTVFSGGCDKVIKMWNLGQAGSPAQTIGQHDAPVRCVHFVPEMNLLASGSWDETVKFWDARQPQPTHTIKLPDRCYAMDVRGPMMVVATARRNILVYNLGNNCALESQSMSTLKYQTRCVSIFPDQTGFAVGSIEGRVSIEYFNELRTPGNPPPDKKQFAFKCHRENTNIKDQAQVFAVNDISFHPYGTFATAGADGTFHFWDKDSRQRLKAFPKVNNTISCATFNPQGNLFAYAASYDWSMGAEHHNPNNRTIIYLHQVKDEEIKPRSKAKK